MLKCHLTHQRYYPLGLRTMISTKILRYCPQLLHSFDMETIAMAALSDINLFKPKNINLHLRPIVIKSASMDLERGETMTDFVESAIALYASETIELTLTNLIHKLLREKGLQGNHDS